MQSETPQLLKPGELADRLRVSRGTITRWRHAGIIPVIQINHSVFRYEYNEVVTALRNAAAVTR